MIINITYKYQNEFQADSPTCNFRKNYVNQVKSSLKINIS